MRYQFRIFTVLNGYISSPIVEFLHVTASSSIITMDIVEKALQLFIMYIR